MLPPPLLQAMPLVVGVHKAYWRELDWVLACRHML